MASSPAVKPATARETRSVASGPVTSRPWARGRPTRSSSPDARAGREGWSPAGVRWVLDEGRQVMTALCDRIAEASAGN
ncbi:hypothetical protein Misp01_32520 [Microtetraspora sp. NBRC 13810]|nr:hypothetical protein Misp01_32520 [Microtetraspora sp. NBRC 13810]